MVENLFETRLGHAWPGEHALTLEHAWGRDQEHGIIFPAAAETLEQQRHVQHHEFDPAPGTSVQKLAPGTKDQRMQDHLEPPERRCVAKYPRAQRFAVDAALWVRDTRKGFEHGRNRVAARRHQQMDLTVGVEDRNPQPAQHHRRRAFPHADRAGQADLFHEASTA